MESRGVQSCCLGNSQVKQTHEWVEVALFGVDPLRKDRPVPRPTISRGISGDALIVSHGKKHHYGWGKPQKSAVFSSLLC